MRKKILYFALSERSVVIFVICFYLDYHICITIVLFVYRFVYVMLNYPLVIFKILALAGNRTPVSRVAGENSTTEPPMLTVRNTQDCERIFLSSFTSLSTSIFGTTDMSVSG